jgi:hypothetical protein
MIHEAYQSLPVSIGSKIRSAEGFKKFQDMIQDFSGQALGYLYFFTEDLSFLSQAFPQHGCTCCLDGNRTEFFSYRFKTGEQFPVQCARLVVKRLVNDHIAEMEELGRLAA